MVKQTLERHTQPGTRKGARRLKKRTRGERVTPSSITVGRNTPKEEKTQEGIGPDSAVTGSVRERTRTR